jgi:hypothetical protein
MDRDEGKDNGTAAHISDSGSVPGQANVLKCIAMTCLDALVSRQTTQLRNTIAFTLHADFRGEWECESTQLHLQDTS